MKIVFAELRSEKAFALKVPRLLGETSYHIQIAQLLIEYYRGWMCRTYAGAMQFCSKVGQPFF
jgi:hypothetical protein